MVELSTKVVVSVSDPHLTEAPLRKVLPLTVRVRLPVPAVKEAGETLAMVGAGEVTVNALPDDEPPPAPGLVT
jgi:hypothetical protein